MIFLIFIFLTSIEQIRADCSFLSTIYHRQSAVENQFRLINESSIQLSASFSFLSSKSFSHFELGLIYQYPSTDFFVPFPVDFNCSTNVDSCQIKSMTNTHLSNNNAESIRVTLTSINYRTARTNYFWQKTGLFLRQGRYQLSNCTEKNGRSITDPRTIFFIEIQYEKPIASQCNPNSNDCGPSSLIDCSSYSSTCQCVSTKNQFASIRIENSSFCADSLNESNCQIFPSRCVDWCNGSENVFCVCPSETRKIQREKKFFCELIDDRNLSCSIDDPIRLCSSSRCCVESRCVDCSNNQQNSTIKLLTISSALNERLTIGLIVTAACLTLTVLILVAILCCLHRRRKIEKLRRHESISDGTTTSSTSSIYISALTKLGLHQNSPDSTFDQYSQLNRQFYDHDRRVVRTDSFYRAVLSGNEPKQVVERVSTKPDSFSLPSSSFQRRKDQIYQIQVPSSIFSDEV